MGRSKPEMEQGMEDTGSWRQWDDNVSFLKREMQDFMPGERAESSIL